MSPEIPLQLDMFSGQLVDTRSAYRKQRDRANHQPQQPLLFPVQEVFQLSGNARPWLKELAAPLLILTAEDPRTPEEIEQDLLREAQQHTAPMFTTESRHESEPIHTPYLPAEVRQRGYRLRARQAQVALRQRAVC